MLAEKKIVEILRKAKLLEKCNLIKIRRTANGMTNENFICTLSNGNNFVIRLPGRGTDTMISRRDEYKNHDLISELELNTEILFFDAGTGTKITRYINNTFLQNQSLSSRIPYACLALKKLHNSGIHFDNKFDFFNKIELYETISKNLCIFLCDDYKEMKNRMLKNQEFLYWKTDWKPCHNDPVMENFLMDGDLRIYLIDWEYSGMNNPLWDIASFALENNLNKEEEVYLWNCYWEGNFPTQTILEKLELFKICQDLLWYVWAKIKESQGEDLFDYAEMRLKRAMQSFALYSAVESPEEFIKHLKIQNTEKMFIDRVGFIKR